MGIYINTKLGYANQNVQLSFTQFSYDSSIEKLESILNSFIPEKDELYTQLFNGNTSSITTSLDNKNTQEKNLTKLSEHSDTLKKFCPLKVPKTHNIKAEYKRAGYYMLSFRWKRGEYEYNARWHTRTPNAPKEQENTWVIERTLKGIGFGKNKRPKQKHYLCGKKWVSEHDWKTAIDARKKGTITKKQDKMLKAGHIPDTSGFKINE